MSEQRKLKFHKGNNLIIILFVFIHFQPSVVCSLHGFSPQGNDSSLSESDVRLKRDSESFYSSFVNYKKFNERMNQYSGSSNILTREIRIKQGRLKGLIREFKNKRLKSVETYLGIPYAAPPVKSFRFMPPGSPPTWKDVKIFDAFGPVCPQRPPDLTHEPLKTMNAGHFNHLKGLMPFLTNQSEDCLYLNIYAPVQVYSLQKKFPVVVYIHGESFEWNSGNPYDGSILASYGNVVVVTINFRLGILGFLRPGLSEHTVSNFGLLDQIAGLQWIKENIEEFGGDSSLVTLMGHGTGAACINFLMVSPVTMASQGLFHKAILMSGTALSDWALTQNPLQFTIQVAEALNCPLIDKNDELPNCLRKKRLSEIMSVKVTVPEFQTPFGPTVDGSVVPNTPEQVMGVYQNLFTRYEMLYGMSEWETYHSLDPVSLTYGMLEGERNELLRKYMYSRYEALPYFALATALSEYLDWRKPMPPAKSAAEEHRDLVLDLLSDARFTAPIIQMGLYHSKINPKSYLYIFQHKSKLGEFAGSERSVSGEEIPYVFGAPLINEEGPLSHHKFSVSEQLLSESILTYFTNFAKTGNPNAPRRLEYLTQGPKEWQDYEVYWPEYDSKNQSYLALGIPPYISHHYRSQMTVFWNKILPDLLSNPTKIKQHKTELPLEEDIRNPPHHKNISPPTYKKPNKDSSPWTYGTVRLSPKEYQREKKFYKTEEEKEYPSFKQMDRPLEDSGPGPNNVETHSSMVPYFVALSIGLLIINLIVIGIYFYKKKKLDLINRRTAKRFESVENITKRKFSEDSAYSLVEGEGSSHFDSDKNQDGKNSGRLKRCIASTSDGHAKVKKWIQNEIEKYSKSRKNSRASVSLSTKRPPRKSDTISVDSTKSMPVVLKPILKNSQRLYQSNEDLKSIPKKNVQKVSIGIDATPSSRGASVLKQTPIEITKSLDRGLLKMGPDASENAEEDGLKSSRRSRTSVSLQLLPTCSDVKSEILDLNMVKPEPRQESYKNNFRTFLPNYGEDVNVTSRESEVISMLGDVHVDPLENIQRRNFPKVLPDFPESKATMRLSYPEAAVGNESRRTKSQNPPPPPPRVSTLQRKTKQNPEEPEKELKTFSPAKLKTPELKKSNGRSEENSTTATDKKTESVKKKPTTTKTDEKTKKREPSIVIQPKIGPKKSEPPQNVLSKKAHINLQTKSPKELKSCSVDVMDTKGPSDKIYKK